MSLIDNTEFPTAPFFDLTPDLVCIARKDGYFQNVNRAVVEKLQYSMEELLSRPISEFIHPADRELTAKRRSALLEGKALLNFQNRYVRKDSSIIWLDWTSIYIPDKKVVFAIAKDVTERKMQESIIAEKFKKLQDLTGQFKSTIEKDRRNLELELHEELAQLASVVRMDLDVIRSQTSHMDAALTNRVEHALDVAKLLINSIRRMSFSISSSILHDLGLEESISWLCSEYCELKHIDCRFATVNDTMQFPFELKLDLYRICQDALRCYVHDPATSNLLVTLEKHRDSIWLSINDEGGRPNSGLAELYPDFKIMQDRAASAGGKIEFKRSTNTGSTLNVIMPALTLVLSSEQACA